MIYFCPCCLSQHKNLKIVYKDYSKEHTKPLFTSNNILNVYNLYSYHVLLELYKILKFRTPYCLYSIVSTTESNYGSKGLSIPIPKCCIKSQKQAFFYKATVMWNKHYKKLLNPFTIKLHRVHQLKFDISNSEINCYDYSTKVSTFKLKLKGMIQSVQVTGNETWSSINNFQTNYI